MSRLEIGIHYIAYVAFVLITSGLIIYLHNKFKSRFKPLPGVQPVIEVFGRKYKKKHRKAA